MAKTPKQKAKATAWSWFSKYIRLRDCGGKELKSAYGRCISCGTFVSPNEADAGHFVPGRSDAVLFDEHNCHLQCRKCNRFEQGKWVEYEKALLKKYGHEEVQRLKDLKFKIVGYSEQDYRDIATKYRLKYKELLNE